MEPSEPPDVSTAGSLGPVAAGSRSGSAEAMRTSCSPFGTVTLVLSGELLAAGKPPEATIPASAAQAMTIAPSRAMLEPIAAM